jgi:cytoskeletal protein RodZ
LRKKKLKKKRYHTRKINLGFAYFMAIFNAKKIADTEPRLGLKFRWAREVFAIDLGTASRAVKIPEKYLTAMEKNRFSDLPKAKVYRLSYVREYAKFLHLNEDSASAQFLKENGLKGVGVIHPKKFVRNTPLFSISIFARNLLAACFILLFAGYLSWQVKRVIEPPELSVFNPAEGITVTENSITVQGETEKECQLAINGQEIMPDEKGNFNLTIDLAEGLNTITITATKKHGKVSTVTRHIVVKSSGQTTGKIITYSN